jgi:hypothetical protein
MFGEACLELYICRTTTDGKEQVYLLPRPANDPFYPNMLHMPGARKIPNETDCEHLVRALKETDLLYYDTNDIKYILSTTIKAKRGTEYADVRRMRIDYNQYQSHFYDVDNLPKNIIKHHKSLIEMVRR